MRKAEVDENHTDLVQTFGGEGNVGEGNGQSSWIVLPVLADLLVSRLDIFGRGNQRHKFVKASTERRDVIFDRKEEESLRFLGKSDATDKTGVSEKKTKGPIPSLLFTYRISP